VRKFVSLAINSSCNFNMIASSAGPETAEVRNQYNAQQLRPLSREFGGYAAFLRIIASSR
jgi:hypothetical protein